MTKIPELITLKIEVENRIEEEEATRKDAAEKTDHDVAFNAQQRIQSLLWVLCRIDNILENNPPIIITTKCLERQ